MRTDTVILGIESSCDDTSASVLINGVNASNVMAGQDVHKQFGGVVPELASRAHQQNIIPVVHQALKEAGVDMSDVDAIGYTQGPGLMGSLLVGSSFAKGLALATGKPLIPVNHMKGHILAHFVKANESDESQPNFPFLCLTVSGGHTQIVKVESHLDMQVIGETLDDAAGEAFDKCAKLMNLPYPGGPLIDKYASTGNPDAFDFPTPKIEGLNFSFSGLKTSVLYFLQKEMKANPKFIDENLNDLSASIQAAIIRQLMGKLKRAVKETGIKEVALAGGVSANSGLRKALSDQQASGWVTHIPEFQFCTDNAAMIAITAHFQYLDGTYGSLDDTPNARMKIE